MKKLKNKPVFISIPYFEKYSARGMIGKNRNVYNAINQHVLYLFSISVYIFVKCDYHSLFQYTIKLTIKINIHMNTHYLIKNSIHFGILTAYVAPGEYY
jgi:hypothetical protein